MALRRALGAAAGHRPGGAPAEPGGFGAAPGGAAPGGGAAERLRRATASDAEGRKREAELIEHQLYIYISYYILYTILYIIYYILYLIIIYDI